MHWNPDEPSKLDQKRLRQAIANGLGETLTTPALCHRCSRLPEYSTAVDENDECLPSGWEGLRHLFLLREEGNPKGSDWTDTRVYGCPECGQIYLYMMDFDGEPGQPWRHTRFLEKVSLRRLCELATRQTLRD